MLAHACLYTLAPEVRLSYVEVVCAQAQTGIGRLRQTCSHQARKHEALDMCKGRLVFKRCLLKYAEGPHQAQSFMESPTHDHGTADTQIWKWNRPQGPQ